MNNFFCSNGEKIVKCMLEKIVGCDNGIRLLIVYDIRMFVEELGKYYRGGRCNFLEIIME